MSPYDQAIQGYAFLGTRHSTPVLVSTIAAA